MADTNEAVQNPSEALFVTGRQVVLNDVDYVRAGVKLVPTVALAVALQAGRSGFGLHCRAFLMSSKMALIRSVPAASQAARAIS